MKTILQWSMLAYPRAWRARYGDELACLLQDAQSGWRDVFNVIAGGIRVRYTGPNLVQTAFTWGLTFGLLGLLFSGFLALRTPDVYRAESLMVAGNNPATGDFSGAMSSTAKGLLTDTYSERIVRTYDLYRFNMDLPAILHLSRAPTLSMQEKVGLFRHDIKIEIVRNRMIRVVYQNYHPVKAAQVANQIAGGLLEAGLSHNTNLKFTVIDPARIPEKPFRPNRPEIVLIGVLCGLALGAMVAVLRRQPPARLAS